MSSIQEALEPLRHRLPLLVREQEVLRISSRLEGRDAATGLQMARREVLAWAQRRCGGRLPENAWRGETFDYFAGGRTTHGVCLEVDSEYIWALRTDDPDKNVPGRIWTTEVTLGSGQRQGALFGLRLLASTSEERLEVEPHTPGLVQQLADHVGLRAGAFSLDAKPWRIGSTTEAEELIDLLISRERALPVFVTSGDERDGIGRETPLNIDALCRATLGLAHVVHVPAPLTYYLTDAFGKVRSVYHGAVRVYQPGFDSDADPYAHPLLLSENARTNSPERARWLRLLAARESLRRTRLGRDVLPFTSVRSAALRIQQTQRREKGASETDQLQTAQLRIDALEADIRDARAHAEQSFELATQEQDRARSAERQLHNARARVRQLEEALAARSSAFIEEAEELPRSWAEFADWCDQALVGRVTLSPLARRNSKAPFFLDVTQAAQCLLWLGQVCRDRRLNGGGSLDDEMVGEGLRNSQCGADAFHFDFQEQRHEADWHIKNGGNTRDPNRCLRIYYAWDPATEQIIVAIYRPIDVQGPANDCFRPRSNTETAFRGRAPQPRSGSPTEPDRRELRTPFRRSGLCLDGGEPPGIPPLAQAPPHPPLDRTPLARVP